MAVTITGRIIGAYRDEPGFEVDTDGVIELKTLTELLQMLLGGETLLAENGIYIDDDVIKLGGSLTEETIIENENFFLKFGKDFPNDKAYFLQDSTQRQFITSNEDEDHANTTILTPSSWSAQVLDKDTDVLGALGISAAQVSLGIGTEIAPFTAAFIAAPDQIMLQGVRAYASTVAAQADVTFQVGGLYTLTGDSVLRIKTA